MELIEIITKYINQENTDFAILINGGWGSGKTFFLKNLVAEEVKKSIFQISIKESKHFELVYISLYGLSSAEELQKKLFLEINPILKTKAAVFAGTIFSKILSFNKVTLNSKDESSLLNIFGGIPKYKILVFDDLERLSDNTINEVFGFINTYTEHQNLKVIIVADEKKIIPKFKEYDKVKEKLIRFTYLFNPDLEKVYPSFIKNYHSKEYQSFLEDQNKFICILFEAGKHKNLRSIKFVLDLFTDVFLLVNSYNELTLKNKNLLLIRFLFFLTTYSIEYKKNGKEENLIALKSLSNSIDSPAINMSVIRQLASRMTEGSEKREPVPDTEKFKEDFENTYLLNESVEFEYYDFLAHYIHSGDLDEIVLKTTCVSSQSVLNSQKDKPEQIALNKLKNCLVLSDEEFLPLIEEIYKYVDQGIYKLDIYPVIFQNLLNCSVNGIENIEVNKDTVTRFKSGMNKSLPQSTYHFAFQTSFQRYYNQDNTLVDELIQCGVELNRSLWVNDNKKLAEEVFALLAPNKINEFSFELAKEEVRSIPIFLEEYITPNDFFARYYALSNADKNSLVNTFFEISSIYQHYKRTLKDELSFYQALLILINQKIEATKDGKHLSTFIDERFKNSLDQIIQHIQALP